MAKTKPAPRYWLMKSEPATYGFDDLVRDGRTAWDGVRNFQARNLLRDAVQKGDRVLFYHSNAEPPGVAGVAEVVRAAYPDPTQFDASDPHHDPASEPGEPRWMAVDLKPVERLLRFVGLPELRANPRLAALGVLRKGNRLSVQPVSEAEFREVLRMGGLAAP
jgi:predicted RNA-binding protein with PUA-like domain